MFEKKKKMKFSMAKATKEMQEKLEIKKATMG